MSSPNRWDVHWLEIGKGLPVKPGAGLKVAKGPSDLSLENLLCRWMTSHRGAEELGSVEEEEEKASRPWEMPGLGVGCSKGVIRKKGAQEQGDGAGEVVRGRRRDKRPPT